MVIFLSSLLFHFFFLSDNNIQWFVKENNEVYGHSWPCGSCLDAVQLLHHSEPHPSHSLFKVTMFQNKRIKFHHPNKLTLIAKTLCQFSYSWPTLCKDTLGDEPKSQKKWPTGVRFWSRDLGAHVPYVQIR